MNNQLNPTSRLLLDLVIIVISLFMKNHDSISKHLDHK